MRHRSVLPRFLAAGIVTLAMLTGLSTAPALAATGSTAATGSSAAVRPVAGSHRPAEPAPAGAVVGGTDAAAVQTGRLTVAQLPPRRPTVSRPAPTATRTTATRTTATKTSATKTSATKTTKAAAQSCTPADFGGRTGPALAAFVESSTTDCINTLFTTVGSDAQQVFKESQMISVAQAYQSLASSYAGDDSAGIWQLVLYLRAGYYVQYGDPTDVGSYDATLSTDVQNALDGFFANPRTADVSSANGDVLGDAVILTDSANLQGDYLDVYQRILNAYSSSWDAYDSMDAVVYDVYTPLWRGQYNPAFVAALTADPSMANALDAFALAHTGMLGGDNTFMDADAGNDLAAYVQFTALQPLVRPLLLGLLHASSASGPTAALWVSVAQQADGFDAADCSYYGVCNLVAQVTAAALPITHVCSAEITILAQSLTSAQLSAACAELAGQDAYFQSVVKDSGPIPGQYNDTDNIVVFASDLDYQIYAPVIYGVTTDNGGITIYNTPSQPGNQDYSILYQDPSTDGYTDNIWNLNYEYTHFLDARYDTQGTWEEMETVPNIWWIEGISGYITYSYRGITDTDAVTDAGEHTYALSTLWQTTYANSNDDRVFPWSYLAVRYMLGEHPADLQTILADMRAGNYTAAYDYYTDTIGTRYDADFNTWLDGIAGGAAGTPTAAFSAATTGLTAGFTDHSTESGNGTLTAWSWTFGDGATSTTRNPSHTYTAAGTYSVTLTVTDSSGQTSSSSQPVTVSSVGACSDANPQQMDRNCSRANQAEAAGNLDYLWLYLPAGTTTLEVTTSGGTGTAYLYYDPSTWATRTAYTSASTASGTAQSLTVTNTTAGYRYLSLYAETTFSGVTVTTQY
ncbi:PKD domain-containing protein [Streptacidiphilus sp. PB12-B1b]|uniref:collagenase n=1 Tax=Streptacidiphilus sp. PB12-B1b TaxID=2705012 RepID=UPI0015F98590|nr:collagenase [Streptacidiphilus sp. PB12-B1b]QMU77297.1 PKD domain-containing protein [Streptacidiphilus sp. PB12-B1b]